MLKNLYRKCIESKERYIHTNSGGDYLIEREDETIYLMFECSDGKEDWISNFNFPATPYKRMAEKWYCHRGFLNVWKSMRDEINDSIKEIITQYNIRKIICVGYSHGAAVAVLATEDMAYMYGNSVVVEGYGFGCPRVLWGKIPMAVKDRLRGFRAIRNSGDIVTHVPPFIWGYRHINLVTINAGKYGPIDAHRPQAYTNVLW